MPGSSRQCISSEKNMSLVDSNANFVGDAFSKLQFFVVQDIFFSNTCRYADVVLPGSAQLGKRKVLSPVRRGGFSASIKSLNRSRTCQPDWKIIQDLANQMGG